MENIKSEIEKFKKQNGGKYSDYYIGITNDLKRRLDEDSKIVLEHINAGRYTKGNAYKCWESESNDEAVEIEQFFQTKGMRGHNPRSKGRTSSRFVYCFKLDESNKSVLNEDYKDRSSGAKDVSKNIKKYKEFIARDKDVKEAK